MVSGHLSGIITSLVLFCGGSGAALFFLRQNFRNDETDALPKKKIKPKAKAQPKPVVQARKEVDTSSLVIPVTSTPSAEFTFELPPTDAPPAEILQSLSEPEAHTLSQPLAQANQTETQAAPADVVPTLPSLDEMRAAKQESVRTHDTTSVHVAIWPYDRVLENLNPDHAFEALSEFQTIGMNWAEKHHVIYERSTGGSFYLHWIDGAAASHALKVALELNQEFKEWNDVRKAEGYEPFVVVMGADRGLAIRGPIGPENCRHESMVGEVIARARALAQIGLALRSSILASEELWMTVSPRYLGERVADASLTAIGNSTSCYKVCGYVNERGEKVWMKDAEPKVNPENCKIDAPRIEPLSDSKTEKNEKLTLWHVNNGSRVLGPLSAIDVARALYSLEIDFDCECWQEGTSERLPIEKSGMFGEGNEPNATFWVFDGDTVHGPLTEAFLRTSLGKTSFPRDSYFCEKTTVLGWKPLMELRASLSTVTPEPVQEMVEVPVHEAAPVLTPALEAATGPSYVSFDELKPSEETEESAEPAATLTLTEVSSSPNGFSLEPALSEPEAVQSQPEEESETEIVLDTSALTPPVLDTPPAFEVPPAFEMPPTLPKVELKIAPPAPVVTPAAPEPESASANPPIDLPILMPTLEVVDKKSA